MEDHRIGPVMRLMCRWSGRCNDCSKGCSINPEYVRAILQAADQADRHAGIHRVTYEPDPSQVIAGCRAALKGESPKETYQRMISASELSLCTVEAPPDGS